jgi:histidyl-tRNA synthetase
VNPGKPKRVRPELLKGFRDYEADDELVRRDIIERVRGLYEEYGYRPLQTPALEHLTTLLGADYGEENRQQIFNFIGPEDTEMGLRFDLTAPLARFVAGNKELPIPLRRYQVAPVWRVDKPGPGRYREFLQFDIDIVGSSLLAADAEMIAIMVKTMECLGTSDVVVKYSTRKILNGLAESAGIAPDAAPHVFRVLDKLEKQGREAVVLELGPGRTDKSGDKIPGLNLSDAKIAFVEKFLNLTLQPEDGQLAGASEILSKTDDGKSGIEDLYRIKGYLDAMSIDPGKTAVDLTVVRGLGYYTGPVYETYLSALPEYGSVFSGGRYDSLISRFSGQQIAATGSSFGVDRMIAALKSLDAIDSRRSCADVLVTTMDRDRFGDYFRIADEIRSAGFSVEVFLGNNRRIPKQLQYADRIDIPVAVICGSDEFEANQVTVKDLVAGRRQSAEVQDREEWLKAEKIQVTIPREKLIGHIRLLLKNK